MSSAHTCFPVKDCVTTAFCLLYQICTVLVIWWPDLSLCCHLVKTLLSLWAGGLSIKLEPHDSASGPCQLSPLLGVAHQKVGFQGRNTYSDGLRRNDLQERCSWESESVSFLHVEDGARRRGRLSSGTLVEENRICNICGKVFSDVSVCRRHMRSHLNNSLFMHTCPFCPGKKFYRKDMLTSHLRHGHKKDKDQAAVLAEGKSWLVKCLEEEKDDGEQRENIVKCSWR